uniref:Secreted protein n=1 Tax=Anopheles culicifacies TaxID=139723 RepID=A0A182MPW7_9DIPT
MKYSGVALSGFLLLVTACSALPKNVSEAADAETLDGPPFLADLRYQCRNTTGDDRTFNELKEHISSDLPKCFMAHVSMDQLKTDTTKLEEKEKKKLFEKICEQINESVTCLTPVKAKLTPCLDEEDVKIMEQVVATIPEALNMACTNSGALLQKFTEPAYRSCAMELPPMIEECTSELPDSMENLPFSQYSDKQCE